MELSLIEDSVNLFITTRDSVGKSIELQNKTEFHFELALQSWTRHTVQLYAILLAIPGTSKMTNENDRKVERDIIF